MTFRAVPLLVCVGPLAIASFAAPVPKPEETARLASNYGTWIDPDKDCRYKLAGHELKISVPASNHVIGKYSEGASNNAPRVLSEVEGDFTAVVRVVIPVLDKRPEKSWQYCSGGLLAWETEETLYLLRLGAGDVNEEREFIWGFHAGPKNWLIKLNGLGKPKGKWFLRLKREGKKLTAGWSQDGRKWTEYMEEVAWQRKIKLGVAAENKLKVPVEITFDDYRLTRAK